MVKSGNETRLAVARGAFAGLGAGVFLTILMTVMSAANGKDVWYGIKGAAAPFLGERAMSPGFDLPAVILGLASHLVISAIWGILFAISFFAAGRAATIIGGILWGFVVWIGMYYVVLPVVGLASMQSDAPVGRAIAFHLFFSGAMTAAYVLYPRVFRGPRESGDRHIGRSAHAV
jgi:hypothetical protein